MKSTPADKQRRNNIEEMAALRRARTHCKRNHPLSGDNLGRQGVKRYCKACKRINYKQRRALLLDEMRHYSYHYLHGKFYGYTVGCRCLKCAIANSVYRSELKTRRANDSIA